MLVLSRKESQRIRLGDDIVITVVRLAGDKVRLGIDAPREMLVLRDELEPLEQPVAAKAQPTAKATAAMAPKGPQSAAILSTTIELPAAMLPQLGSCCTSTCCLATA